MSNTDRSRVERAARYAAVADVARLAVVDELALGDRSPSELQELLGMPSNLLTHHLNVLESAGVIARQRSEGDRRRVYVTLMDATAARPQESLQAPRVLFVCTGNAARSQLAAAMWRNLSVVPADSAGTAPGPSIASGAIEVAGRRGLHLGDARPHRLIDVVRPDDLLVCVCDRAYEGLGATPTLHWSVPDPVPVGTRGAFDQSFDDLRQRINTLAPHVLAA